MSTFRDYLKDNINLKEDNIQESIDKKVIDNAISAFWSSVAKNYPKIKSGDIDPIDAEKFYKSAKHHIARWIWLLHRRK